jgi:hypothetical protein
MNSASVQGECLVVVYGNRKRNIHITISSQECRQDLRSMGVGGGGCRKLFIIVNLFFGSVITYKKTKLTSPLCQLYSIRETWTKYIFGANYLTAV